MDVRDQMRSAASASVHPGWRERALGSEPLRDRSGMGVAEFHAILPRRLRVGVEAARRIDLGGELIDRRRVPRSDVDQGFERAHGGGALENLLDLRLETPDLIDMARQCDEQTGPGAEVEVDGLSGDASLTRDFPERDGDEVFVLEQPAGSLEDGDPGRPETR